MDDLELTYEADMLKADDRNAIIGFFKKVDKYVLEMNKAIVMVVEKLPDAGYGPAKQLQVLYGIEYDIKKYKRDFKLLIDDITDIDFVLIAGFSENKNKGIRINDISDIPFVMKIKDEDGKQVNINCRLPEDSEIQKDREDTIQWYKEQLNSYLDLEFNKMADSLEHTIKQVKNMAEFPDVKDWFLGETTDPRIKFHSQNFWGTAFGMYYSSQSMTWPDVYDEMKEQMENLGLKMELKKGSFITQRKREQKKRNSE